MRDEFPCQRIHFFFWEVFFMFLCVSLSPDVCCLLIVLDPGSGRTGKRAVVGTVWLACLAAHSYSAL